MRFAGSVLCWVLAITCAAVASAPQQTPVASDQQAVIELERAWNDAFYAKDIAFIEGVLADEFTATYDDGSRGDRARELALSTEFNQQLSRRSRRTSPSRYTVRPRSCGSRCGWSASDRGSGRKWPSATQMCG